MCVWGSNRVVYILVLLPTSTTVCVYEDLPISKSGRVAPVAQPAGWCVNKRRLLIGLGWGCCYMDGVRVKCVPDLVCVCVYGTRVELLLQCAILWWRVLKSAHCTTYKITNATQNVGILLVQRIRLDQTRVGSDPKHLVPQNKELCRTGRYFV